MIPAAATTAAPATTVRVIVVDDAAGSARPAAEPGTVVVVRADAPTAEAVGAAVLAAADPRLRPVPDACLNGREREVLALLAAGHNTREVAEHLCYSERTVKNILHDVAAKLRARSRCQAVARAVREGLI